METEERKKGPVLVTTCLVLLVRFVVFFVVMATTTERVLAAVVLLTVRFVYCSAQGGCSPPEGILITGDDKLGNNVPSIMSNVKAKNCKLILFN